MKKQFIGFGGGLITGVLLVMLFSASAVREESNQSMASAEPQEFHPVRIEDFFRNVANYRDQHVRAVRENTNGRPSRMFIYNVSILEQFFKVIADNGSRAGLKHDELAIRFYYAVYPKKQKVAGHEYGSLHTLYMVPNYWDDNTMRYRDLDLIRLADAVKNGYPGDTSKIIEQFYLESLYEKDRKNATAFMLDATAVPYTGSVLPSPGGGSMSAPLVINQGQLCPPNCPDKSLLDYVDAKF